MVSFVVLRARDGILLKEPKRVSVLDQIYEAALLPELWPEVLGRIAKMSNAHSGALLIIDPKLPPLFAATPNVIDTLAEFARTPYWYENPPAHRLRSIKYCGFLERADFFTHDEINSDNPYHANMEKIGAAWQVGSVIDMPDGEMALFTFERGHGLPDFDAGELARLDTFRPILHAPACSPRASSSIARRQALQP